jgi:glycosyltransferase involved in cell wall biosynthesis
VRFHGFLPHDALAPLAAAAHVYVQSSRHEAAGHSVLEAAMAGVPVAGTRAGHLDELAPDAAVAVEPGDAAGLAAAIAGVLDDPARRAGLREAGRAFALAHDADATAAGFLELYAGLRPPQIAR